MLSCGKDKAVKLFKELDTEGGIGLIERKRQGQGRPTKIYVKNFTLPPNPGQTSEKPKPALLDSAEVLTSGNPSLIRLIRKILNLVKLIYPSIRRKRNRLWISRPVRLI